MSDADQSGAGRREVAYRLFAAEYDDADLSYSESDEERAPNYVVTPTGARVNRLFVVGVLTEVETVGEDVLRARVVDPTGAFVLYAGQYQPDEQAFLDAAETPAFVAVTGKARTFQPDDSDRVYTSVRPESINEVTADTRDRWTVRTVEQTLERVGHAAAALSMGERGDALQSRLADAGIDEGLAAGIPLALDHYDTSPAYLDAVRRMAVGAARLVAGETDEVEPVSIPPAATGEADLDALAGAGGAVETDTAGPGSSGTSEPTATATRDSGSGDRPVERTEPTTGTVAQAGDQSTEDADPGAGATATDDPATDTAGAETATEATEAAEATEATDDQGTGAREGTADVGDFDPGEFELDETEREEIETEYGTEFQSGTEVEQPGEAAIETREAQESEGAGVTAGSHEDAGTGPTEPGGTDAVDPGEGGAPSPDSASSPETGTSPSGTADATDGAGGAEPEGGERGQRETGDGDGGVAEVELADATVEVMAELDEGDGAERSELVETVASRYGASPGEVEDAIQDALMDGRCYEPDEDTLKPI